ncbi:hypothetical protein [Pendulispora albinea]|uniref:Uncharacterized protein n=1 Tax=Pendulispora albinea TaxID=2741071 RepID=A0ABZ2M982_9BACT
MTHRLLVDPQTHKRFLDYRERHQYFARQRPILTAAEFTLLDGELRALVAKGAARDDEEEARLAELRAILLMD